MHTCVVERSPDIERIYPAGNSTQVADRLALLSYYPVREASLAQAVVSPELGAGMLDYSFGLRATLAVGLAAYVAFVSGNPASACACCAEPGERYIGMEKIDDYTRDVVDTLRFDKRADLYTTAADWSEQIKGIANPAQSSVYRLKVIRTRSSMAFDLSDKAGHAGRLTFQLPGELRKFHADTNPQPQKDGNYIPTKLYKEWQLTGAIVGDRMFNFKKQVKAHLIFHGRGNGCTSSEQFTNWTLDVKGTDAGFRFFGRLTDGKG
jgi:hypothetical protein